VLLALFAFLGGLATVTAPCVLPVLPVVLAAGATGDRWRPLGIMVGLVTSFSTAILFLSVVIIKSGLHPDVLRWAAAGVLAAVGLVMVVPALGTRFEVFLSRVVGSKAVNGQGKGFWSGVVMGLCLGVVWTPCAGPILAALISLIASTGATGYVVVLILIYAIGAAVPLGLIAWGGKAVRSKVKFTGRWVGIVFGSLVLITAAAILLGLDRKLQAWVVERFPGSTSVIEKLENRGMIEKELEILQ
jgi:cytochrome c-type biogenesis protein